MICAYAVTALGWRCKSIDPEPMPYAVTADGQRILALVRPTDQVSNPVIIVVNWMAALRK